MKLRLISATPDDLLHPSIQLTKGIGLGYPADSDATDDLITALRAMTKDVRSSGWGTFWAEDEERDAVVGLCGFKTEPSADGSVEIAYYTFPMLEGKGIATAMATRLVEHARKLGARRLVANSLPVINASVAVLKRNGFALLGQALDPEDGLVWS